jgi:hypothetical protein
MFSTAQAFGLVTSAVAVVGSGLSLTRGGRPYAAGPLAIHKLVTVAAVVFIVVAIRRVHQATSLSAAEWAIAVTAGALVLVTITAGGIVTATARAPVWLMWLHRISSWIALVATVVCVLSLRGRAG